MWLERARRYLLPKQAEQDNGFRESIQHLSHIGLQVVAGAEIAVATFMGVARFLITRDSDTFNLRFAQSGSVILIGVISLLLSQVKPLAIYSRRIAITSGLAVAAVLIWFSLLLSRYDVTADDFMPGQMTLIMLVAVAALPVRPMDTFLFGFVMASMYVIATLAGQSIFGISTGINALYVLFLFMLTLLATGLTAVVYEQRRSTFEWHLQSLRAADDLRQAEGRNLLAQNAASAGRLAAALSHELNSPIGALVSGVDTLLLLASRQATAQAQDQQRLVLLQNELRKSIKQSTDRLKEIVLRMQRFTNLDKAEVQSANVNDLLSDVAALLEPQYREKATVDLKLQPVPDLVCRPQQLSAVFSSLLLNSVDATDGDGRVTIATSSKESVIEIAICDNGRGLTSKEIEGIFDPGFKVDRGRISTGNWGMFSSRQIVLEHGGDISLRSVPGNGTCVNVVLPCSGCGAGMEKPS